MLTPTLHTARLVLRPLALSDAPAVQRHVANWTMRWIVRQDAWLARRQSSRAADADR
jgi:hypothetical protein